MADCRAITAHLAMSPNRSSFLSFVLLAAALFAAAPLAYAARTFPDNSHQVWISAIADDAIIADGDALHVSPAVLIFNPTNSTIVKGALEPGVMARVQLDMNGDVRRIWILNRDEIIPRPWWKLWGRQPDGNPSPMLPDGSAPVQPNPNR
jgi:hypothetical protein